VLVVGAVVGTLANDAVGYYWGVIAVLCAIVPAWWLVLRHHLRGGLDRGPVPPTDTLAAEGGTP
jgi:hypothetical protein